MRIEIRRTGGFAGIERRAEVETSGRPDADDWHTLAERCLAAAHDSPPAGVPDGFSYRITVDGRTVMLLTGPDSSAVVGWLPEPAP